MFRKILGVSLFVFAAPALAGDLSYNFVELGYQKVEFDEEFAPGVKIDGDGYGIGGSVEIGDSWFIGAGYSKADLDFSLDVDQLSLGVGYHVGMSERVDFFATLSYVRAEASFGPFEPVDEDGYGATVGVRGLVAERFELFGSVGYVDLGDAGDGTSFAVGGLYSFTDNFALGLEVETDDDFTSYGLGARFYFGN